MQKIKLFMVLALLCVGVSGAWGQKTYTVNYVPSGVNGSFAIENEYVTTGQTTTVSINGRNRTVTVYAHVTSSSTTDLVLTPVCYYNGSYYTFNTPSNYNSYITFTTQNAGNYISANSVDGYENPTIEVANSGTSGGTVTITYEKVVEPDYYTWTDGIFDYSTKFVESSSNTEYFDLANQEVAISLHMGGSEASPLRKEVTDTVFYTIYATAEPGGYMQSGDRWYYYTLGTVRNYQGVVLNTTEGSETTGTDDCREGDHGQAKYKCLGLLNSKSGFGDIWYDASDSSNPYWGTKADNVSGLIYYERTHTVSYSDLSEVEIPASVVCPYDGKTYKVVAIQKSGFVYAQNHCTPRQYCLKTGTKLSEFSTENGDVYEYGNIDDHRNDYLTKVTYAEGGEIRSIGDYAFQSCTKLTSFTVPYSVTYLGDGQFENCYALKSCVFATNAEKKVQITKIPDFCFWMCVSLQSLDLPDGITEVGEVALQYNFQLSSIRLPNTLTKVGSHFICCATSLKSITIPATLNYIDGAFLHGCESLEEVYLLGQASYLKAESNDGNSPFDYNHYYCAGHVSKCNFYTTSDYIGSYLDDDVWNLIYDEGQEGSLAQKTVTTDDGTTHTVIAHEGYGNKLTVLEVENREYPKDQWLTACFQEEVADYEATFGQGTRVAIMESAEAVGGDPYRYLLKFRLIENTKKIEKDTPVLICAGEQGKTRKVYDEIYMNQHKDQLTVDHEVKVIANNGAIVRMIGRYEKSMQLLPGDFYFISNGNDGVTEGKETIGQFYKVVEANKAPKIKSGRCRWTIDIPAQSNANTYVTDQTAKMSMGSFWDEVDGSENQEKSVKLYIEGIYDIQGRKIDIPRNALPQGLYVIDGKKVSVK